MAGKFSELGRRVLGSLPAWAKDEPGVIEAEGGPEVSERSHTQAELVRDLAANEALTAHLGHPVTEGEVGTALRALQQEGLAEYVESATVHGIAHKDAWRMTQAGLEALVAPVDDPAGAEPGAAFVHLNPAKHDSRARG